MKVTLTAARVNAGMTQPEAAEALGIGVQTIINYETGKISPRIDTVLKMVDLYGVPLDEIDFKEG